MLVEEELARQSPQQDTVLAVGVFDGVHLGHKYLISQLVTQARKQHLLSGVVTFQQHPQDFFSPRARLPFLTDLSERIRLLKNEGIDFVVPLSFTAELAQHDARSFVELLQEYLRMRGLVVGPDFALGRNREGDVAALRKLAREKDFNLTVVAPFQTEGDAVSSTAIRKAIAAGDMEKACRLMGRPFSLHGKVVPGTKRGGKLGFPTANVGLSQEQALPADGVYVSRASVNGKTYPAVANIGKNPTFGNVERTAEVHLIDFQGDLYGQELKVDVMKRLRGEKKFESAAELQKQIAEDVAEGKAILSTAQGCQKS